MELRQPHVEPLALDGGTPIRTAPLPQTLHGIQEVGAEEIAAVTEVLERRQIFRFLAPEDETYAGRLEAAFRAQTGRRFALATTGGTNALVAALAGLGVGVGDEVIVPGYTFVATAAAVLLAGAIPVIAEIDDTLTLDPRDVERKITPLTRCVIPVHMRGLPCQMDELLAVARRHDLLVLEDCAQANGGTYRGRPLGSLGDAAEFSLGHHKLVTSGDGGVLATDDERVWRRACSRHDSGMGFWRPDSPGEHAFAGSNDRMCELRAAVGVVQMGRLPGILARTRALKRRLVEALRETPGVALQRVADPDGDCGIVLGLSLPSAAEAERFSAALAAEGVANGTIHNQGLPDRHVYSNWTYVLEKRSADRSGFPWAPQFYAGSVEYSRDMCPNTLDQLGRAVTIGISQRWSDADAGDVIAAVRKVAAARYGS